jgi:hypothetical protein
MNDKDKKTLQNKLKNLTDSRNENKTSKVTKTATKSQLNRLKVSLS